MRNDYISKIFDDDTDVCDNVDQMVLAKLDVDEVSYLKEIAASLDYEFKENLDQANPPDEYVRSVPVKFSRDNLVIGVDKKDDSIVVATSRPFNVHPLDDLSRMIARPVTLVLAKSSDIAKLIDDAYREKSTMADEVFQEFSEDEVVNEARSVKVSDDLMDVATKAPIVKLVNMILFKALKQRASDVHIQPYEDVVMVRNRIDGILYDTLRLPIDIRDAVISRVKVMGKMDIAERRMPQDGRTSVLLGKNEIDLRISVVPTSFGERAVLRILDKSLRLYTLEEIGLSDRNLTNFKRLIRNPNGILFVTGPTGSGKTTTLYASLMDVNSVENNVITIEDPIEYQLKGISQIQIAPKKNLTFATGLRSVLRQDPDVIMVGEVRDTETARMAIQSAQTGHLVFSTLHTNDSPGALVRLIDLGIEPFLVASSVIAVLAQRLVRLICPNCKEQYRPDEKLLKELDLTPDELKDGMLWRGKGCPQCMNTGFRGRTGIYELLIVDDDIQELVMRNASASEIKNKAVTAKGLTTLRMDGTDKVTRGLTTIDEVIRVTQRDVI